MRTDRILWADDEIDLLKPHILFLQQKGYDITTVTNGLDAVELCQSESFDLLIIDENMPGLSGLETLVRIKNLVPNMPVIMITKSEEENIMHQAIGNKIADYLIKPVNPHQILLSLKKNLDHKEIISQQTNSDYRQTFNKLGQDIALSNSTGDWINLYKELVGWELQLENAESSMMELLQTQKDEANSAFAKFVRQQYTNWMEGKGRPLMSPDLFKERIFPMLDNGEKVFVILIDNFRLDQWKVIQPLLAEYYNFEEELYYSILPTATQYARNSIFSGLMPDKIATMFPDLWVDEDEEEGKNLNESPLIQTQLDRFRKRYTFTYHKINESAYGDKVIGQLSNMDRHPLNVIVFNFIDMLSHARTESKTVRELASTPAAYRSLTESWFKHSSAFELFRRMAEKGYKVVLTTDHGTIGVHKAIKVVGDKNTNSNLRYKVGRNLTYNPKEVFEIKQPEKMGLPSPNVSSTYIFAMGDDFFAYPNNYNYYVSYYKDTFQHGGISMEEMMIPFITLTAK